MKVHFLRGALSAAALIASTHFAAAADMAVRAAPVYLPPPVPVVMPFNWTGFYLGAHTGWANGTNDTGVPGASMHVDGWLLGGQLGYNWQAANSPLVLGVELDATYGGINGKESAVSGVVSASVESDIHFLATARARVGLAVDRWMPYVTGGMAWANNEIKVSASVPGFSASATDDQTHFGWTIGGGLEWAFANNWSAKAEYLYSNLGDATYFKQVGGGIKTDLEMHTFKVGLNYRFF